VNVVIIALRLGIAALARREQRTRWLSANFFLKNKD
jgi:hypothetical protein